MTRPLFRRLIMLACAGFVTLGVSPAIPFASGPALSGRTVGTTQSPQSRPRYGGKYYGNWCGPDWSGGEVGRTGGAPPVDALDGQCKLHDLAYAAADEYWSPRYAGAGTDSDRDGACSRWLAVYRSADAALTRAARALPSLVGTVRRGAPDAWNYDPRIFGPHPRTTGQRHDYRDAAIVTGNLSLFKVPPCALSNRPGRPGRVGGRTDEVTVTVPATRPWTDTGIDILRGDRLTIRATGLAKYADPASQNSAGPDGSGGRGGGCGFVVVDPNVGAHVLVGNVSRGATLDGKGFQVGSRWTGVAPIRGASMDEGRLYLGFNDGAVRCDRTGFDSWGFGGDNSGAFTVSVTIVRGR